MEPANIRALCPICKEIIYLPSEKVVLHIATDAVDLVGPGSHYRFSCYNCDAIDVTNPADMRIAKMLSEVCPIEVEYPK